MANKKEPPIQNIPIRTEVGRKVREAFTSSPIMKADYAALEQRVVQPPVDTVALAEKAARHIVEYWEKIPEMVENLVRVTGLPGLAKQFEKDFREKCGGEETYEICKSFLAEEGFCRICGDKTHDLDEHLKKHSRAAEGDEDCRGGAHRP